MPREVAQTLPERMRSTQAEVRDAHDALRLVLRQRRDLILEAIDVEGMSQQEVAGILGMAKSRVSAILASPDDDDE